MNVWNELSDDGVGRRFGVGGNPARINVIGGALVIKNIFTSLDLALPAVVVIVNGRGGLKNIFTSFDLPLLAVIVNGRIGLATRRDRRSRLDGMKPFGLEDAKACAARLSGARSRPAAARCISNTYTIHYSSAA